VINCRVLDRYILKKEFRHNTHCSGVVVAAQQTINENRQLFELLRDS